MANNEAIHSDINPSYIAAAAITTLYKVVKLATARNTVELATANSDAAFAVTQDTAAEGEAIALKKS